MNLDVTRLIKQALREDIGRGDITSRAVIPPDLRIRAHVISNSRGVAAGVRTAALVFTTLDPSLRCRLHVHSGAALSPGKTILTIEGRARSIFAAERVALNFLMHLSGIATLTNQFVRQVRGTRARILDTRKTLPMLRMLEKYAVGAGGGHNHRRGLDDAVLIKTNHLKVMGHGAGDRGRGNTALIQQVVARAKRTNPGRFVEIEVANLTEFRAALAARPNAILLDNWNLRNIRHAVRLRSAAPRAPRPSPLLEVSGGVTLTNVRRIARAGVDRISIGTLTHSAPSLNVALRIL